MKAQDLRINNTVFSIEKKVPTEIQGPGIQLLREAEMLQKKLPYQPIELTKEWLLKFGFEKIDRTITSAYENKGLFIYEKDKRAYYLPTEVKYPEYVHQLQNLYFALTGKELEIKD